MIPTFLPNTDSLAPAAGSMHLGSPYSLPLTQYARASPSGLSYATCHAPMGMWVCDPLLSPRCGPSSLPVKEEILQGEPLLALGVGLLWLSSPNVWGLVFSPRPDMGNPGSK